jgi:hypothetical protein
MVNRVDAWGKYLPLDERAKGKARTAKGELTKTILIRHYRGAEPSDLVGLHSTSPDDHSLWLGIDVDQHGEVDKEKERRNRAAAIKLFERAKGLGFRPLLIASNGRGGYHLIILFRRPTPTWKIFSFGQWLLRDWEQLGLDEKPELFPKQPRLGESTKYGNWLRLAGRHHTFKYYSQVWTGTRWATGDEAIRIILRKKGVSAKKIPAEAFELASQPTPAAAATVTCVPPGKLSAVQKRALTLLRTKEAIQGQGGDKITWTASLYLIRDFALTMEQALPVMLKWNATHCHPPWSEKDLIRKLRRAEQEPGPRGRLLAESEQLKPVPAEDTGGEPFCAEIPDFILCDWDLVRPYTETAKPGRRSVAKQIQKALILASLVLQRASRVHIPDVLFAQLLWGGDHTRWPQRWRRALRRALSKELKIPLHAECPPACPLHHCTDVPHRHFRFFPKKPETLGDLHHFWVTKDEKGVFVYDFRQLKSHHPVAEQAEELKERIDTARRAGSLCSIYLPAWLFGPRVLQPGPCHILQALTRELTRVRHKRCDRPDRAEVVSGDSNPLLTATTKYVAFAGNGRGKRARYHGRGYRLEVWLERAGYAVGDKCDFWATARQFLRDLHELSGPLGLVVGATRSDTGEWHSLDRLLEMSQSEVGRKWLKKCRLLVFSAEDYLLRWRRYFAKAFGFSFIPGGMAGSARSTPVSKKRAVISSALELDAWMCHAGMTNRVLAKKLGVPVATVGFQRAGSRPWSADFERKLCAYLKASRRSSSSVIKSGQKIPP